MKDVRDIPENAVAKALKLGADDAVCKVSVSNTKQVRFTNNEIVSTNIYDKIGGSIFLSVKKKIVASDVDDLSQLDSALSDLIKLARNMKENKDYFGIAEGKFKYRKPEFDRKIPKLNEELVDYVTEGINAALSAGARRAAGVLYTTYGKDYLHTSKGVDASDEGSSIEFSVRAFTEKDASGHWVNSATSLSSFSPKQAGEKAGELARKALKPETGPEGKFNVIFDPMATANLLNTVGSYTSAYYVDSGLSFFKDKVGKKVGSEHLTLSDDGSIAEGLGNQRFDDEGVPTRRTVLIEKGVLKTYLHNTSTAKKYGCGNTANAGLIVPRPWNIVIEKGDMKDKELFREMKSGIYITNLWYGRFQNYEQGDFSIIPRDAIFLVKNGELTTSLKSIRISDNILRILSNIQGFSKEVEQIHWWEVDNPTFAPFMYVKDVNITKSTQ